MIELLLIFLITVDLEFQSYLQILMKQILLANNNIFHFLFKDQMISILQNLMKEIQV